MSLTSDQLESIALRCTALGERQNEVLHRFIGGLQAVSDNQALCILNVVQHLADAVTQTEKATSAVEHKVPQLHL